jgi:hypothetical protein
MKVRLNDNIIYPLPPISDPESHPFTTAIFSTDPLIFSFVTVAANQLSMRINPVDFMLHKIGTFPLTIKICDGQPACS